MGYKYFQFKRLHGKKDVALLLQIVPKGIEGSIDVWADSPWENQGGILLGSVKVVGNMPQKMTTLTAYLPEAERLDGKHAIYLIIFL